MAIRVERVTNSNQEEYRQFVRGCQRALVQQTWEWGQVVQGLGQDRPAYFLAKNEEGKPVGALPAFVYECELGSLLISIPQPAGYGGVVVEDLPIKEEVYKCLLAAFVQEAKNQRCVLATICTAPFFGDRELYNRYFKPDFEKENFYQFLDLKTDFLLKFINRKEGQFTRGIKSNIRTAQKFELVVTYEDSSDRFERWYELHQKRTIELQTQPHPKLLFEKIRENLFGENLGFIAYVMDEKEIVSGGIFVGLNQVIDFYGMGVNSEKRHKQPYSLLVFEALKHASDRGYKYYNWQSSSSRESGVYQYKKGWGSPEGLHYYLTKITGDISRLQHAPLEIIKQRYQWHYVMPYEQFKQ